MEHENGLSLQRSIYKRLLESIAQNPSDYEAYNDLGTYYSSINPIKALRSFQRAIEINPNYPVAFYNLANVLRDTGNLEAALIYYKRAIALDPCLLYASPSPRDS